MSKPIIPSANTAVSAVPQGQGAAALALSSLSLCMLLSSLGTSIANVGLPTLTQTFDASFGQAQWIVVAYLLTVTALVVGAGRLGDIVGRRRVLLGGIAIFTIASLFCGVAPTLWLLIAGRAMQGFGAAFMMALTLALVSEIVVKPRTGSAMGLLGTMSAIGTALGPSLGGLLIAGYGWRAIFLIKVPFGILTFIMAFRALPADRRPRLIGSRGFDGIGTVLLAAALVAYALAMTLGRGSFGLHNAVLLVVALFTTAIFIVAQAKAASPLLDLRMFRDATFSSGLAASLLVSAVVMTTLVVGPFYLSRALALDPAVVGIVVSIGPIVVALTGVPAGRLADRFGTQTMTVIGLMAMTVGCSLLAVLPSTFAIPGYVAPIAVITAGYALFQTANNTAVMTGIAQDRRGVVSGMLNLSRNLGLITGASAMGAVFVVAAASLGIEPQAPDAVDAGMRATFAVAALMIVAAIVIVAGSRALAKRGQDAA